MWIAHYWIFSNCPIKAAILFPASRPYSVGAVGYPALRSLAPMFYASAAKKPASGIVTDSGKTPMRLKIETQL